MTILVYHPERCPDNVKLQNFVDWWSGQGPFAIVIVCGNRTDGEQRALYAQGRTMPGKIVTQARTAAESAHGHSGAIDCLPVRELYSSGGVKLVYTGAELDGAVAEAIRRLNLMAGLAEESGLVSGRNFPGLHDIDHIEDPDWKSRPLVG